MGVQYREHVLISLFILINLVGVYVLNNLFSEYQ